MTDPAHHAHTKLNQFFATAICGNDILSSALYVSGIAILFAGVFAPLVLLFVALVLFFYKSVYTEVVEALPINGGAYNCLLNSTSKIVAAIAGVMTTLSYIATAVISAKIGVEYLSRIVHLPVIPTTIVLLFLFALLVISGIKDSAKVALGIFIFHLVTLTVFLVAGLIFFLSGNSFFAENIAHTGVLITNHGSIIKMLFLAFAASLLGISGFESSANFVEEQKPGVFRKTLRNMLIGVTIINPLVALVVLNSMPYGAVIAAKDFLLADAAFALMGPILEHLVVIDAFLVLLGAVLTSYVGVSGLLYRMASDGCLPNWLEKKNSKDSYPRIILTFFVLCTSILLLTGGNLLSLAGVYTIAFLGVMSLFALGNLILKQTRTELKRTYRAPVIFVIIAFLATFAGIIGNILIDPNNFVFFGYYFIPSVILVCVMVYQDAVFRFLLRHTKWLPRVHAFLLKNFHDLIDGQFVVFIRSSHRLHDILEYINKNETGWNITLVYCDESGTQDETKYQELETIIPLLKKAGVFPHLRLTLLKKHGMFGPDMVTEVSKELGVHTNRILIGSIHHHHDFDYADLGGARIIS